MISAYYRHKARTDLEFGDIDGARKNLRKATTAYNAGCLLNIIGIGIVIILMMFFAK